VSCYRRALQIDPGYAHAHCCLAQALLATGRYEEGWEEFEWRWRGEDASLRLPRSTAAWGQPGYRRQARPAACGAELRRPSSSSAAPLLAPRGARVVALCVRRWRRSFGTPGSNRSGSPASHSRVRYHAPLMSLPRAFDHGGDDSRAIPCGTDPAAVATWRARLSAHPAPLKVGLHGRDAPVRSPRA
jgi:hypothetical protein